VSKEKMTRATRLLLLALRLALLFISVNTTFAQQPGASKTLEVKTGQSIFVAGVKGDCARRRPNGLIKGKEF
jgi:hypothetical protein